MRRRENNNPSPTPPPFSCVAGATFSPPGGARVAGAGREMSVPIFRSKAQKRGNREKSRKSAKITKFPEISIFSRF